MKATYRLQGLPEVSKSFSFIQFAAKEDLLDTLGFWNPRSAAPPNRRQEVTRNETNENPLMDADSWRLIRKE